MSAANNNGRREGAPAPSVVRRRIRRRTPKEIAALPPVRTKPIRFSGLGLGGWGRWEARGTPPSSRYADPEALLDWALISWARRHVVELVWDFTSGEPSDDELPSDAEVIAIAREAGLEVVDDGPA